MRLSVIIPVYNGHFFLPRVLQALAASSRRPDEVLVVDDGSTDGSGSLSDNFGVKVLTLADGPQGPARARNRGAAQAEGDILVFLDADVMVHPDTLGKIEQILEERTDITALFGSYDADPPVPNHVSRFKNLLHHSVHQQSQGEIATFWAGCGAIRREDFNAVGGFCENFLHPMVEDIELGLRLKETGRRVLLVPEVQVTHLKTWDFFSLIKTDIFHRAVPWTRLILAQKSFPATLNLDPASQFSALLAWMELVLLGLGFWHPSAWLACVPALGLQVLLNRRLYHLFVRKGRLSFALSAVSLHHLYLLYSSLTFAIVAGLHVSTNGCLERRRKR